MIIIQVLNTLITVINRKHIHKREIVINHPRRSQVPNLDVLHDLHVILAGAVLDRCFAAWGISGLGFQKFIWLIRLMGFRGSLSRILGLRCGSSPLPSQSVNPNRPNQLDHNPANHIIYIYIYTL